MDRVVVIGHGAFTVAMFGVMLAVQLVIYPQFREVAPAEFASYAAAHANRIVLPLALLAPFEIGFAAWLWLQPPDGVSRPLALVSGLLLVVAWIATAVWFAPMHGRFQDEYDRGRVDQLITTNWIRTALWAARAGFAVWFLNAALRSSPTA
ncbi:MAG: hypothetical protein AAF567_09185 [Actinomycetota bacterium]